MLLTHLVYAQNALQSFKQVPFIQSKIRMAISAASDTNETSTPHSRVLADNL
jgi:hypothetical protein